MLKRLAILGMFGALLFGWPCVAEDQQRHPDTHKKNIDQNHQPLTPPTNSVVYSQNCCNPQPPETKKAPDEKPLPRFARPEWVIVYITAVYVFISAWTLIAIRKQSRHTARQALSMRRQTTLLRKAADASEISAKAAMGVAVPTLMLSKFAFVPKRALLQYDSFQRPQVTVEVKNFGQSPAFLKAYSLSFFWEDELPEEPAYPFPFPCSAEDVIDPGQTYTLDPETTNPSKELPAQVTYDLESGKKHLTIYGYVSYGDVFGSPIRYMKFSKRIMDFDSNGQFISIMDHGGHKFTGQHEHYDGPNQG